MYRARRGTVREKRTYRARRGAVREKRMYRARRRTGRVESILGWAKINEKQLFS